MCEFSKTEDRYLNNKCFVKECKWEELKYCIVLGPNNLQIISGGAWYLVGDPASKVLNGEFREGHLWLQIQWVVTMVIVTLLKKGVVRCLMTRPQTVN